MVYSQWSISLAYWLLQKRRDPVFKTFDSLREQNIMVDQCNWNHQLKVGENPRLSIYTGLFHILRSHTSDFTSPSFVWAFDNLPEFPIIQCYTVGVNRFNIDRDCVPTQGYIAVQLHSLFNLLLHHLVVEFWYPVSYWTIQSLQDLPCLLHITLFHLCPNLLSSASCTLFLSLFNNVLI